MSGRSRIAYGQHEKVVWVVRLSPDSKLLAACGYDMQMSLYSIHTKARIACIKCVPLLQAERTRAHQPPPFPICIRPDFPLLVPTPLTLVLLLAPTPHPHLQARMTWPVRVQVPYLWGALLHLVMRLLG